MLEQTEKTEDLGNTFLDDLLDFVNVEEERELGIENEEGFQISNPGQANYFARKLKELRAEKENITKTASDEIEKYKEKVKQWEARNVAPLEYEENRLLTMLETFARQQLEGSTKKSMKLVEGTLQFRKQSDLIEYDDDVLLEYVQKNMPELIRNKPSVDKKTLKAKAKVQNGRLVIGETILPGVRFESRPEKFDIK